MTRMKTFLLLGLIFIAYTVPARAYDCKRTQWPYAQKMSDSEFRMLFDRLPRQALYEYFLFEVTKNTLPKDNDLFKKLAKYIFNTEVSREWHATLELLLLSAEWTKDQPRTLVFNDVCEFMDKVEHIRSPASIPKKH